MYLVPLFFIMIKLQDPSMYTNFESLLLKMIWEKDQLVTQFLMSGTDCGLN